MNLGLVDFYCFETKQFNSVVLDLFQLIQPMQSIVWSLFLTRYAAYCISSFFYLYLSNLSYIGNNYLIMSKKHK